MPCPRCAGLMVVSCIYCAEWARHTEFYRCVSCGNVVDRVIVQHQRAHPSQEEIHAHE
jgi:predicted RNA-binding Zn-ribbon protein involved in translation (DUF1610 family)